jgi:N6-adenosine-specific RNA methylase IME4
LSDQNSLVPYGNAGSELEIIERWRAKIERASSWEEIKTIRDQAEVMRQYAARQRMGLDVQNTGAEIKLRAERRLGEWLAEREPNRGTQGQLAGRDGSGSPTVRPPEPSSATETLNQLGVSKSQSSRWQRIADVPEDKFEAYLSECRERGDEITSKGAAVLAARGRQHEPVATPDLPEDTYRAIAIDPPWPMAKIEREERPNQGEILDYPVMTLEEIAALPVADLAAPDGCHVYLWTTHKFLPDALDLFRVWGVRYQCLMTWVKNVGITPYSWMYDTEHVLFGRIGSLQLEKLGMRLSFTAPVAGHSVKPDVFYGRVLAASPSPRLEMFARRARDGFEGWGNEVEAS